MIRKPAFLTRNRPLIGVTGSRRGGLTAWNFHRFTVWRAGGWAVRLTPRRLPRLEEVAEKLDGLIVGGGDDIGPGLYGGSLEPEVRLDPERDERTSGCSISSRRPGGRSWAFAGVRR